MPTKGRLTTCDNSMTDIMKHEYLRQSIENRVQRKVIEDVYHQKFKESKLSAMRHTRASELRSLSIVGSSNLNTKSET